MRTDKGGRDEAWWRAFKGDRWVLPYFKRYRRVLALALCLGMLAVVLGVLLMFASGWLIGAAAHMPPTIFALMVPIATVQLLGLGKPIASYFERLASHDWVFRMTSDLRRRLFLVWVRLAGKEGARRRGESYGSASPGAGDALSLLDEDIAHVQNLYVRSVFPLVVAWAATMLFALVLGVADAGFAALMLLELFVCAVLLPLATLVLGAPATVRRKRGSARLYRELADTVLGAADVVFAGRVDDRLSHLERAAHDVAADDRRLSGLQRGTGVVERAALAVAAVGLVMWAAQALPNEGNIVIGVVLCFFPLVEALAPVSEAASQLPEHAEAVRRLNGLGDSGDAAVAGTGKIAGAELETTSKAVEGADLETVPEATGGVDLEATPEAVEGASLEADPNAAADVSSKLSGVDVAPDGGRRANGLISDFADAALAFDGVTFAYPGAGMPVIDNLDFAISSGEKMALLGRSGAGKSTMLGLIRGDLQPLSGRVLLGGGTHPGAEAATSFVGVIQQDPHVFNSTVLDNLRLARADLTEEEARAALERVGLWKRVERFERGLYAVVGEEGRLLSGGERHRLALARILLADTPLVLLDEPFAGLDPATERSVLNEVLDVLSDRAVLMVTHHLQGIERFDRVAFLEDGRFVLDGSPAELAQVSERYRHLLAADRGLEG